MLFSALATMSAPPVAAAAAEPSSSFTPEVHLMSEREAEVFRALEHPNTRARFLDRFWSQRETAVRQAWDKRLPLASSEFSDLSSDRARIFLTAGPPFFRVADLCPAPVAPHEIWHYDEGGGRVVVFVKTQPENDMAVWRQNEWQSLLPDDSDRDEASRERILGNCERGRELAAALAAAGRPAPLDGLDAREPDWVEDFLTETTLLPASFTPLEAEIELGYPAAVGKRTAAVMTIVLPTGGEADARREFALTGEIFGEEPIDAFRLQLAAIPDESAEALRLSARRHLPPGRYRLDLKLREVGTDRYLRETLELDVPARDLQEPGWAEPGERLFKLLAPPEGYLTGAHRFETIASHPDIFKVSFYLGGERVLTKNRPPYSVELDLGVVPRPQEVEAVALDARGFEVARDRITVNSGPHRFTVRLIEPHAGARIGSTATAHAVVETPLGERLSHVDFVWNETRLARLHQPPFVQTLRPPEQDGSSYLRAIAVLEDGHSSEDLVVVNTGDTIEAIDVDFVELYASVLDERGNAVEGIARNEFRVFEDGIEQELRRFETVENLPINAAVVLDSSTSMTEEIREAETAAAQFFEDVLEPKDRAAVVVFNDVPHLRVPLTNDTVLLNNGLAGIEADGETVLYDSLIYGLYYLAGLRGKRALILLSDGADSASDFSFDEALEFAKRSGVAIYTIGLGLRSGDVAEHTVLRKLAHETGGACFFVESARRLDRIYDRIEQDLRSQYLLGYQSPETESKEYREVRVEVERQGLEAKSVPGYYP